MGDTHGRNTIAVKRPGPWLYVTEDPAHSIALLRGDGARQVVEAFELEGRYSKYGRGWVIPARYVADVVAYCQARHQLCVISNRKPEQKGAA